MFGQHKNALEYTRAILNGREGFHIYAPTAYEIGREILKNEKFYTVLEVKQVNPSNNYILFVRS